MAGLRSVPPGRDEMPGPYEMPGGDEMEAQLQLSQLRYVTTSRAAATTLAENYCGYPPLRGGLLS